MCKWLASKTDDKNKRTSSAPAGKKKTIRKVGAEER